MRWEELIFDLISAGLSGAKIAARLGIPASTLGSLKNGDIAEPRWSVGEALIQLHRRYQNAGLIGRKDSKLGAALPEQADQAGNGITGRAV